MSEKSKQYEFVKKSRENYSNLMIRSHLDGMVFSSERDKNYAKRINPDSWPDIFVAKPVCDQFGTNWFHGLYIEFKTSRDEYATKKNKLRKSEKLNEQKKCMIKLRQEGYYCDFAGAEEAEDLLVWYLSIASLYIKPKKYYWDKSVLREEGL
jgi:hypothetical protein